MLCFVLEFIFCVLWIFLFPWRLFYPANDFSELKMSQEESEESTFKFKVHNVVVTFKPNKHLDPSCYPQGRSGHRVAASSSCLYSFGGFNPNDEEGRDPVLFRELWEFNLYRTEWRLLPISQNTFPTELASMCKMEKFGSKLLIHGGTGLPFGFKNGDKCYAADISENTIELLNVDGVAPEPRYGHASFLDRQTRRWYVVGGTSGTIFFMDIFYLDLTTRSWNQITPSNLFEAIGSVPKARYRHEIAITNNKIVVFGGGTLEAVFSLAELPAFDLKTERWETIATIPDSRYGHPRPRFCHSGLFVPGEEGEDDVYVISGGIQREHLQSFNDIWSINLSTWQWYRWRRRGKPVRLPVNLHFHDAALTPQGKMMVFGGISTGKHVYELGISQGKRRNFVFSCWVKIPRLTEIAWEAVQSILQRPLSEKEMISLGIPREFINRTVQ